MRLKLSIFSAFVLALLATPLAAQEKTVVRPLGSLEQTWVGQPIVMPRRNLRLIVSTYEIPPGIVLPVHKHPYPRYAYVQAGSLRVTAADSGKTRDFKPGDFIVESVDEWHFGTNTGTEPVRLLVMDYVPKAKNSNSVLKK